MQTDLQVTLREFLSYLIPIPACLGVVFPFYFKRSQIPKMSLHNLGMGSAFLSHPGLRCPHVPGARTLCAVHFVLEAPGGWPGRGSGLETLEPSSLVSRGHRRGDLHCILPTHHWPTRAWENEGAQGSVRHRLPSLLWAQGKSHYGYYRSQNLRLSCP